MLHSYLYQKKEILKRVTPWLNEFLRGLFVVDDWRCCCCRLKLSVL
jgi:hypothetical protein